MTVTAKELKDITKEMVAAQLVQALLSGKPDVTREMVEKEFKYFYNKLADIRADALIAANFGGQN